MKAGQIAAVLEKLAPPSLAAEWDNVGLLVGDGESSVCRLMLCIDLMDLYRKAIAAGATFYLTGEMRHHDALAATAEGLTVVCLGHSNSERIALRRLAKRLAEMLPKLTITVSKTDRDPFEIR